MFGNVQILRWLDVNGGFNTGRKIYYDPVDPFQGAVASSTASGSRCSPTSISIRASTTTRSGSIALPPATCLQREHPESRTTYQFNKHFLVRLLEQFDSSSRRLLTDLLASYEFVPGTVFTPATARCTRSAAPNRTACPRTTGTVPDCQPRPVLQGVLPAPVLITKNTK